MIGERIGNYVITEKLGEGGMGEVYLAAHPQIGKRVALKVLHPELAANEQITTRFFHEAKAVNDISHPNIVDILDFGSMESARGTIVYLVMELLNGSTLTKSVEQGPLEPMRAVKIVRQVADALVASHERGIVHRDLKPDNIMLVARGREAEFVKLLDFGIAKVTGGAGGGSMSKTRTGMVIGTPIYMSPEQCEGRGDIDHRTDVYALGVVLYELLTGAPPFTGDGYAEILVKQLTEVPEPISQRRPGISRYLESIVMKCLAKRRDDRFQTMRELLEALSNPQEFVEARGGVGAFGGPTRPNPPTGPQMPTPYIGNSHATPTPLHGNGQPTPLHGAYATPTPMHGAHAAATQVASGAMPTPLHGGAHAAATQIAGAGGAIPTPLHGGYAQPTPFNGTGTGQQAVAQPYQTTLSGGVGEVGRTGRGTEPPAFGQPGRSNKKLLIGAIAGAAVVAGAIAVFVIGGGGGAKNEVAAASSGSAAAGSSTETGAENPTAAGSTGATASNGAGAQAEQPQPPPPEQPQPAQPQSPPPQPETGAAATAASATTVKVSVTTTPAGASVFVGTEASARCTTPCAVELAKGDTETKLAFKLAGFVDEKKTVTATQNIALDVELTKKAGVAPRPHGGTTGTRPGTGTTGTGTRPPRPVGDNTLNPFDN